MFETRRQVRGAVLATTLALALCVAGTALAAPAAGSGGWWTSGLDGLASWWGALWNLPETARAGSETAPDPDPASTPTQPAEPDGAVLPTDGDSGSESEAYPNLDPDG